MTIQRTANLNGICYEVAILEPPVVGQLETTVEQVGNWKEKDCYVVERQTAYGEAIARILGYGSFLGRTTLDEEGIKQMERDMAAGSNLFFLPHMTLCDHSTVDRLGINVGNFYGGIVGFEHERTKLIMHDLLHPPAIRPDGWNERFANAISHLALPGYSVFALEDLKTAVRKILASFSRARIKLATGADGLGQFVVDSLTSLEPIIQQIVAANIIHNGACVEVDLNEPTTYSINTDTIGDLRISSIGVHRRHMENPNAQTEIGTDYNMVVGNVDEIRLELTSLNQDHVRRIIDLIHEFDQQVSRHLPHILLTRKTYQAIIGTDDRGQQHMGVLEQSWRRGGSSANTLLAAQEFLNDPNLVQVSCSQDNSFSGNIEPGYWVLSTCRSLPVVSRVTSRHFVPREKSREISN